MRGVFPVSERKWQKGFSLIEIMITVAVVSLALVGYIGANMSVQQSGEAGYERTVAIQDAHRVIEQMRNATAAGQFPANVTTAFPDNGFVGGFTTLTNEQVQVTYADAAADPLDVTVTVSYRANGRRNVNAAVRSIITQRV